MTYTVRRLEGRRGISRFIDFAWRIERGAGSLWVPPLRAMVRDSLDRRGNPFYRNADYALFLAERDGRPVARVAAIENGHHTDYYGDSVGFFGFLESQNDPEAAQAVMRAAEEWLAERGKVSVRGPVNPSMHQELGILVDGYDVEPSIMTPWNPPYYGDLLESCGYEKVRDLLGFELPAGEDAIPDRVRRLAERHRQRTGLKFRTWEPSALEEEARKVHALYCEAWDGSWGFVPPTWGEFWHMAKDLKAVLHPDFAFVAEMDGEPVGFIMIARDINRILKHIPSGRLWPWNVARLLMTLSKVRRGRIVLLGLKRDYRNQGLFPLFASEVVRRAQAIDAEGAEASWILEENEALLRPLRSMGLTSTKRWRIYEKAIG
ncbi:MAG TPA: N-acetyltransferase [Gemmatimonadetes bacterium]|nr:N-acetyltransferase [Gemmatimonadota bacterium]